MNEMEDKFASIESKLNALEIEIRLIKEENVTLKVDLENTFENMKKYAEIIIQKTTEAMIEKLNSMQNDKETRTDLQLEAIERQLSKFIDGVNASSSSKQNDKKTPPSKQNQQVPA